MDQHNLHGGKLCPVFVQRRCRHCGHLEGSHAFRHPFEALSGNAMAAGLRKCFYCGEADCARCCRSCGRLESEHPFTGGRPYVLCQTFVSLAQHRAPTDLLAAIFAILDAPGRYGEREVRFRLDGLGNLLVESFEGLARAGIGINRAALKHPMGQQDLARQMSKLCDPRG